MRSPRAVMMSALAVALAGCLDASSSGHSHASGHGHDDDHAHGAGHEEGHGHGHEEGHGHGHEEESGPARPSRSVTLYQSGLELFMEHEAFVVGMDSPLIAHFTDARDPEGFRAITEGRVTATLRLADGSEQRFVAERPLRAGVFKPVVRPTKAGKGTLTLQLEGAQAAGSVDVGDVVVYPSIEAAAAAIPEEPAGEPTVAYLKEAQWKTEYATAVATSRVLLGGVRATGELKPVAGQAAELTAPATGRVITHGRVPHIGLEVNKGDLLTSIVPTVTEGVDRAELDLELARATTELGLAERELARARELFEAKAIPEKQLEAAAAAHDVAKARLEAARRRLSSFAAARSGTGRGQGTSFDLRSPIDGTVAFADLTPGAVVEAGTRLLSVVNHDKLWLEAHVPEQDAPKVEGSPGASFTVAGLDEALVVDERNGRRVAVGVVVDPLTRTVPIVFELDNPGPLKPGMYAKVTVFTGETVKGVAIPLQAVVDDGGRPTVYVMDGGESFFKRRVRLGVRSGGYVQVLDGVKEGERVVSRGAYEIKLATSMGGIPEHGHQH